MATYKKLGGQAVKTYSSDPPTTYPSAWEGQLYYNSADGSFKFQTLGAGAWSSGGNLNTGRLGLAISGFGTATAAYAVSGESPSYTTNVETYNGSSWTETTDVNNARSSGGADGSATAGLVFSGESSPGALLSENESWNGSAWTEVGDINTGRRFMATSTSGANTAVLATGGLNITGATETWNGSSWTEVADLNTNRYGLGGVGTSTALIAAGGYTPPSTANVANVESWNGSAWTETTDINTSRRGMGSSGPTSSDSMIFAGEAPGAKSVTTESWNGSSWTEVADLSTARGYGSSGGITSTTAVLYAGGQGSPTYQNATEEWAKAHTLKKVTLG